MATPLVANIDEPCSVLIAEEASASSAAAAVADGGRLFWGTALGAVCTGTISVRPARGGRGCGGRGGGGCGGSSGASAGGAGAGSSDALVACGAGDGRLGPLGPLGGGVWSEEEVLEPPTLALRITQKRIDGHATPVTALCHCAPRNVLCSGASDGSVCVWALASRELRGASTRLLGRLGAPLPMGRVLSLTTVLPPGGAAGAPRVVAAGAEGHLFEWDLRGGKVCRSVQSVPSGLAALVLDARAGGNTMWAGRPDGVLQLWRWPEAMAAQGGAQGGAQALALTDADSLAAAHDGEGGGEAVGRLALREAPPVFSSILQQLEPVGGLARPPTLAAAASPTSLRDAEASARHGGPRSVRKGGRPAKLEEFDCVITPQEAAAAAAEAEAEADPLASTLSSFLDTAEFVIDAVGDTLEDGIEAVLGGPSTTEPERRAAPAPFPGRLPEAMPGGLPGQRNARDVGAQADARSQRRYRPVD